MLQRRNSSVSDKARPEQDESTSTAYFTAYDNWSLNEPRPTLPDLRIKRPLILGGSEANIRRIGSVKKAREWIVRAKNLLKEGDSDTDSDNETSKNAQIPLSRAHLLPNKQPFKKTIPKSVVHKKTSSPDPVWQPQCYQINPSCPVHSTTRSYHRRIQFKNDNADQLEVPRHNDSEFRHRLMSQCSGFVNEELDWGDYMNRWIRHQLKGNLSKSERRLIARERGKLNRNLCAISFAFLFLISAFQGLQNLQTSINGTLGSISLSVVYSGSVISCLFLPPYLLNKIGCKRTLILSMMMMSVYMLVNFSPTWFALIPGSILVGASMSALWAAKCTYLTEIGLRYAVLNFEPAEEVVTRYFGLFFMIVHLGQVIGNLASSRIIMLMSLDQTPFSDEVELSCGHYFGPGTNLSSLATQKLSRPPTRAINSVVGIYFSCTLVAWSIIAAFLNQLRRDFDLSKSRSRFEPQVWNETIRSMKKAKHLLLIPLTIFNGMEQAFISGTFTTAYVSCCLGVANVGEVMTCFGVCNAICCLVFGPLIKLFGRMPLFMFGAVVDMLMIFTLLLWPPNPSDTVLFYVIAAAWGMADGVWSTQINGLWAHLFEQNLEVAFANYRLWESVGFTLAFAVTTFLGTEVKLYLLLTVLLVGMTGYVFIEIWDPLEDNMDRIKSIAQNLCLCTAYPPIDIFPFHEAARLVPSTSPRLLRDITDARM